MEFHIHQIHFQVDRTQRRDPFRPSSGNISTRCRFHYWSGTGPYPSVTLLMDFRSKITGDFVYTTAISWNMRTGA